MNTHERITGYAAKSGSARLMAMSNDNAVWLNLTPAQRRRVRKKHLREMTGKTHEHTKDGRCYVCRPARRPGVATIPMRLTRAVNAR